MHPYEFIFLDTHFFPTNFFGRKYQRKQVSYQLLWCFFVVLWYFSTFQLSYIRSHVTVVFKNKVPPK